MRLCLSLVAFVVAPFTDIDSSNLPGMDGASSSDIEQRSLARVKAKTQTGISPALPGRVVRLKPPEFST